MAHTSNEDPINYEIAFAEDDAAEVVLARDNYSVVRANRKRDVWHLVRESEPDE